MKVTTESKVIRNSKPNDALRVLSLQRIKECEEALHRSHRDDWTLLRKLLRHCGKDATLDELDRTINAIDDLQKLVASHDEQREQILDNNFSN